MRLLSLSIALAAAIAATSQASAQARPDSLTMSCAQAQALVQRTGAVVLGSGPNLYDRYVSGHRFCTWNEMTVASWVPTTDSRQCFIGYRCMPLDLMWSR